MKNRSFRLTNFIFVSFAVFVLSLSLSAVPFVKLLTLVPIVLLPGIYAFLAIKPKEKVCTPSLSQLLFSLGFGIFGIYISTLTLNMIGRGSHWSHILDRPHIAVAQLLLAALFALAAYARQHTAVIAFPKYTGVSKTVIATCLLVPLLAIFGAIRLNNGGNAIVSIFSLILMSLVIAGVSYKLTKGNVRGVPLIIYSFGLSVLLLTSLRGWYITGHDVQTEYYVFQLAFKHQVWNISAYQDPYNACLSITLLPTFFASLFHIDPLLVFKTIFQLIFATLPVAIYLIGIRFGSKLAAFLASIIFISFPIFVNDITMYNRQEVAFVFLGLALLAVVDKTVKKSGRQLFLLFMLGMVLSHYSTTYIMCGILLLVLVARRLITKHFSKTTSEGRPILSIMSVVIVFAFVFLWVAQLTGTQSGPLQVVSQTLGNLNATLSDTFKSSDTSYIFFGGSSTNPAELFGDYVSQQNTASAQAYTNASDSQYAVLPQSLYSSPLTRIGHAISTVGVPASSFVSMFRSLNAKLLQLLLFAGVIVFWFKWRAKSYEHREQYAFYLAGIVLTLLVVVLPFLTYEYSLLRTFQQVLIFASLPIAEGVIFLASKFKRGNGVIIAAIITFSFASLTGLLPALVGGYYPQLNLSNKGTYYDLYYTHASEEQAFGWWQQQSLPAKDLTTNLYAAKKFRGQTGINPQVDVLPDQLSRDQYVYLDYTTENKQLNYVFYKGDWLVLKYPVNFLDNNKNLVYNNSGSAYYQ